MTYQPSKPVGTDFLSTSVTDIQQNFSVANNLFGTNHFGFTGTNNSGNHKYVIMPELASAIPPLPLPTTPVDTGALYVKEAQSIATLFWRQEGSGAEIQLTGATPVAASNNGQTFLPGGLIMKWGVVAAASTSTYVVTFSPAFPNNVYNIAITPTRAASSPGSTNEFWVVTGYSSTGFTIFNNGSHNFGFLWSAIGN